MGAMDVKEAIVAAMDHEGTDAPKLSVAMGKSSNYIYSLLSRDSSMRISTLEAIASSLGYEIEIVFRAPDGHAFHANP